MRNTFATAAIVATSSAYNLDAKAIPDWIAGFLFELTGDNKLSEIEQCYQGGEGLVNDAKEALSDLKNKHFIKGAKAIGKVVGEFSDALNNCENMDDDLATLKAYGEEFTHVGSLAKMISKNWLLHHK